MGAIEPPGDRQHVVDPYGGQIEFGRNPARQRAPIDHQFVRPPALRQRGGRRPNLERRRRDGRAHVGPGEISLREFVPIRWIDPRRDRGGVEGDFRDQALMQRADDRALNRQRRIAGIDERPVLIGRRQVRRKHVVGAAVRSGRLIDVEPTAEIEVDLRSVGLRREGQDVRRVGLLAHRRRRRVDAVGGEAGNRHIFAAQYAGERDRLAVRIVRRAPVLRAGRIVERPRRALRLEQAEEHAHVRRADEPDIVHFGEREVEHLRLARVFRVDIELRGFVGRQIGERGGSGAAGRVQGADHALDETGRGGSVGAHRRAERAGLPRPRGEDAQIHAEPGRVAVQQVWVRLLDERQDRRRRLPAHGDAQRRGIGRRREPEFRIVRIGEVEVVDEREALQFAAVASGVGEIRRRRRRQNRHSGDAGREGGRRGERRIRAAHAEPGRREPVDHDAQRVLDRQAAWRTARLLAPRRDFVLADRVAVEDDLRRLQAVAHPKAKIQQACGHLLDDVLHLAVDGVKRRRVRRRAPFERVGKHFRLAGVDDVPGVRVVVRSACGRIKVVGGFDRVVAAAEGRDAVVQGARQAERGRKVGGGNVFLIGVAADAALAVERGVEEIHARVGRLVLVVAPAVEDVLGIAVQVDEIADVRKLVEHPLRVAALGLREGARPVVDLLVAGVGRIDDA